MTRHLLRLAVALLSSGLLYALAEGSTNADSGNVKLQVSEHETHGEHLADDKQVALYLFLKDEPGISNCYDSCAEKWPPFRAGEIDEAEPSESAEDDSAADAGIDAALLATADRNDGTKQITYNGWPLYYFVRDEAPGDVNGQGVGEVWYLVSPAGDPLDPPDETAAEAAGEAEAAGQDEAGDGADDDAGEESLAALMEEGEPIFRNICAACHGAQGQGGVGPRLDGRAMLKRSFSVINTILWGIPPAMPSFADDFSNREIAAVATYVRNSWSNDHGLVPEEEVREWREKGTR